MSTPTVKFIINVMSKSFDIAIEVARLRMMPLRGMYFYKRLHKTITERGNR